MREGAKHREGKKVLMHFGREVNWKQRGTERLVLTFLTINESEKWLHLKMSELSYKNLEEKLTLLQ